MSKEEPAPPPQGVVMQMVMGAWASQTISSISRLNVPDLVQRHGPLTAAELTSEHGVDARPDFLERALRACAALGIFSEDAQGRFAATPLSEVLTTTSPVSVKKLAEMFGGTWWKVWAGLPDTLRTGEPQPRTVLGMEYWDYCNANPQEMEDFAEAMKSNSLNSMRGVLEHCDFSDVTTVVDVAGGLGHMVVALLSHHLHLSGVVMDLPDLEPLVRQHAASQPTGVQSRMRFEGGDMFEDVPGGQVYILKHIIHDWDDARCTRLLQNCRARMQEPGRLLCVDAVLPPMGDTGSAPAKLLDLNMMVFIPGKERTEAQWQALYREAGFRITSITPLNDNFGTSIVEGVKA